MIFMEPVRLVCLRVLVFFLEADEKDVESSNSISSASLGRRGRVPCDIFVDYCVQRIIRLRSGHVSDEILILKSWSSSTELEAATCVLGDEETRLRQLQC